MKPYKIEYQVINHGVDHSQYFNGCGTYGTPFTYVVTGCGNDAVDAYNDCLDQIASSTELSHEYFPKRPKGKGINRKNKVPSKLMKEEGNECWYYVSIRWLVKFTKGEYKSLSYSYATSPNAEKFGFSKTGCWTINIREGSNPPYAIAGFLDREEAGRVFNQRPEPVDPWTCYKSTDVSKAS